MLQKREEGTARALAAAEAHKATLAAYYAKQNISPGLVARYGCGPNGRLYSEEWPCGWSGIAMHVREGWDS
jgi:hypothetical protein